MTWLLLLIIYRCVAFIFLLYFLSPLLSSVVKRQAVDVHAHCGAEPGGPLIDKLSQVSHVSVSPKKEQETRHGFKIFSTLSCEISVVNRSCAFNAVG
jgi:hypothetical protein